MPPLLAVLFALLAKRAARASRRRRSESVPAVSDPTALVSRRRNILKSIVHREANGEAHGSDDPSREKWSPATEAAPEPLTVTLLKLEVDNLLEKAELAHARQKVINDLVAQNDSLRERCLALEGQIQQPSMSAAALEASSLPRSTAV